MTDQTENVEEIAIKISQWPKASGAHKRITVITQGVDPGLFHVLIVLSFLIC